MIKKWISIIVPEYIFLISINILLFSVIIQKGTINISLIPIVLALSLTVMGFNSLNMVFDKNLDKISKPFRPLPRNEITPKRVIFASIVFYSLSLIIGLIFDSLLLIMVIIFIIGSILYTHPYFYMKRYIFSSNLFGALFYSAIPFIVIWRFKEIEPLGLFLLFFILTAIIATTKEFEDSEAEKKFGIKSLANTLGKSKTSNLIIMSMEVVLVIVLLLVIANIMEGIYLIPTLFALLIPLFLKKTKRIKKEKILTQGNLVTKAMIALVTIELLYALPWLINFLKISL